jgi:hypothetical protein
MCRSKVSNPAHSPTDPSHTSALTIAVILRPLPLIVGPALRSQIGHKSDAFTIDLPARIRCALSSTTSPLIPVRLPPTAIVIFAPRTL